MNPAQQIVFDQIRNRPSSFDSLQLLDEKKLQQADDLFKEFETPEKASQV